MIPFQINSKSKTERKWLECIERLRILKKVNGDANYICQTVEKKLYKIE